MSSDDQRIGYLADGDAAGLSPDELAELDEFASLLDDPSLWVEPPTDLGDRVVAAIAAERAAAPSPSPSAVPADQGLVEPTVSGTASGGGDVIAFDSNRRRAGRGRSTRWVQPFVAGMAVAAVTALGVFAVARGRNGDDPTAVLALAGTELAPAGVGGTARITETESGLRIELDAAGLPRREGRQFYQAWLKGEAGLVPIGTFHTGDKVVLWAGVALADFPTLTVTLEEVGDQESSGQRVLIGKLGG